MGFLITRRELEKNDQEGTPKDQAKAAEEKRKAEDKADEISTRITIYSYQ